MAKTLFTVDIVQQYTATGPGSITVTEPAPRVYLVTFESPPDNRLSTNFINSFLLVLDIIEHRYPIGVVITTSAIKKFYSNGMDLELVAATPTFFPDSFYPFFRRLSTFPMPTIALINGHAFAGGFIFAMHHDYRFQSGEKGYISLNEVLIGVLPPPPLINIFREKLDPTTLRDVVLEGQRFGAKQSLERKLIDGIGGLDEALNFVKDRDLLKKTDGGVFGQLKDDLHRTTLDSLLSDDQVRRSRQLIEYEKRVKSEEAIKRVEAWEKNSKSGGAKL